MTKNEFITHKLKSYPSVPFIAPFAGFVILMGIRSSLQLNSQWEYPAQIAVVSLIIALVSFPVISWRASQLMPSIALGIAVFVIWVGPDWLSSSYRHHWIFENSLTGVAVSSLRPDLRSQHLFLVFRIFGTALVVPIIEELFWRGWLMRYLIHADFRKVPLGTYTGLAFWGTAILFATEHGPYWEVGLLAGIVYNWWMMRTRNLVDCMIAHAVTNGCLAIYVVAFGHWEYWL
jgi:CAAX prenyl protease-like protein